MDPTPVSFIHQNRRWEGLLVMIIIKSLTKQLAYGLEANWEGFGSSCVFDSRGVGSVVILTAKRCRVTLNTS